MLVGRGSMYSVYWPLLISRRATRSVSMDPVHASPLRSATASHGALPPLRPLPLGHAFGLGIEHADRVALIFGKPQPAFAIDATPPRAGVRGWSLVDGRILRLCIDLDDITGRKIEQIGVVLRVRV